MKSPIGLNRKTSQVLNTLMKREIYYLLVKSTYDERMFHHSGSIGPSDVERLICPLPASISAVGRSPRRARS